MSYTVPESIESGWSLSFTRIGLKSACWQAEIFGKYLQFRHGETWPLQREELISFRHQKFTIEAEKTISQKILSPERKWKDLVSFRNCEGCRPPLETS